MKNFILFLSFICSSFSFAGICYRDLCIGDIVRDTWGYRASVTGFETESEIVRVQMSETGAPWTFTYSELGKLVDCYKSICIQDTVFDHNGNDSKVLETFTNGLIYVFDDDYDGYFLYRYYELRPSQCY